MIPFLLEKGFRVIVPDMIGYGQTVRYCRALTFLKKLKKGNEVPGCTEGPTGRHLSILHEEPCSRHGGVAQNSECSESHPFRTRLVLFALLYLGIL